MTYDKCAAPHGHHNTGNLMVEHIFHKSRFLVWLIVIASLIFSILLYLSSFKVMGHIIADFSSNMPTKVTDLQYQAVYMLKALDNLFIALTFQIISISHYGLFLSNTPPSESKFLQALHISSYHDVKINILQVSLLILVIIFLEQLVARGAVIETLYLSLSIATMMGAIIFAVKSMRH
ncbi:YqhA family protein [Moraxella ovis]|nr:YqhA family protein [Moraxella ovis]